MLILVKVRFDGCVKVAPLMKVNSKTILVMVSKGGNIKWVKRKMSDVQAVLLRPLKSIGESQPSPLAERLDDIMMERVESIIQSRIRPVELVGT